MSTNRFQSYTFSCLNLNIRHTLLFAVDSWIEALCPSSPNCACGNKTRYVISELKEQNLVIKKVYNAYEWCHLILIFKYMLLNGCRFARWQTVFDWSSWCYTNSNCTGKSLTEKRIYRSRYSINFICFLT